MNFYVTKLDYSRNEASPERWAKEYCPSFIECEIFDYSDFNNSSTLPDTVALYKFTSDTDVLHFNLRWQ